MKSPALIFRTGLALLAAGLPLALAAQDSAPAPVAATPNTEIVEVTTTRIAEPVASDPAEITIVSGQEMIDRGATDLHAALALVAGIDIAPAGDGGPASSVPEFMGLKEFDAFLLVVDGVPWGGAFNPALSTLDLHNIERIEVLRGAAPVSYGATSFVGVINVIHKDPKNTVRAGMVSGGSYGSLSTAFDIPITHFWGMDHALSFDAAKTGFKDKRTQYERGHIRWSSMGRFGDNTLRMAWDGTWLNQMPGSPHPRDGKILSTDVPLDANHNPLGSHLNNRRLQFNFGLDHQFAAGTWSTTVAVTRSTQTALRGFITDLAAPAPGPNANGFREVLWTTDVYLDSHFVFTPGKNFTWIIGVDHLNGVGTAYGGDFDYFTDLDGKRPPNGDDLTNAADIRVSNSRAFSGLYTHFEWRPSDRWLIEAGGRINHTRENRATYLLDFASGDEESAWDRRTVTRGGGAAGITFTAWKSGANAVRFYGNYRNTFKPAAMDFGVDSGAQILEPETAESWEFGNKNRLLDGRLSIDWNWFQMDFKNLVISNSVSGLPVLLNAGKERFKGSELELAWAFRPDLRWRAVASYHDAKFTDSIQDFGGTPTQLAGKRIEMSPHTLVGTGVTWAPLTGWGASFQANYVGNRFLNKRNTALTKAYTTVSGSVAYRHSERLEFRLRGENLNDQRPPIADSELGDAEFYRLPARRIDLSAIFKF
jgi:outer membrane receptor protein involved in Fe transport